MVSYNAHIRDLSLKYKQFFEDDSPGQILAMICPYTFPMIYDDADRGLDTWDFEHELRAYMEWWVRRQREFMRYTADLDNDYVPAHSVNFGYGVHSAYLTGAEVRFGTETSWTLPWLTDWGKLSDLHPKNTVWFSRIMDAYDHLIDLCEGDYALCAFANAGPGDMANAIRGDQLFTDLYDYPDEVHQLMNTCADALIWLEESIRTRIGTVEGGGVIANMWFPNCVPFLSEDFNDLIAPRHYEEFGAIYTQKVLDHFGGAYIHHHAKGAHIHDRIARLHNLTMLEQSWDPGCSPPIDRVESILEMHGGLPLMIRCHARDVYRRIDALKRGRVVIMLNVDTLDEGRDVMRFIRKHSII